MALPHQPPGHQTDHILGRVRALLAKAESTEFPEEAEALTAKAQELMARHAIDQVRAGGGGPLGVERWTLRVPDPYASAKVNLIAAVAAANRCRAIWTASAKTCTVYGHPTDLTTVEVLVTSLMLQMTQAMLAEGPRSGPSGQSRTRSFRQAFILGFAARIGQRLDEVNRVEVQAAADEASLVPVFTERLRRVDDAVAQDHGRLRRHRASLSNAEGLLSGRRAADQAGLGQPGLGSRSGAGADAPPGSGRPA